MFYWGGDWAQGFLVSGETMSGMDSRPFQVAYKLLDSRDECDPLQMGSDRFRNDLEVRKPA